MLALILLLVIQVLMGKAGYLIAALVPYQQIDPFNSFAEISIHHAVQFLIAALIILALRKILNLNFYFQLGDKKKGIKYFTIFTAAFVVISIAQHIYLAVNNQLPVYAFPLDKRNVVGTLAFQLLLSGPVEEVVFRALPITILIYAFGKSFSIKGNVTLEVILASVLFSFAHIKWSLSPFVFEVNYFQMLYSFVLGTIQGIVYQKSKSVLYPMLMHSSSNVLMVGIGYLFKVLSVGG